MVVDEVQQQVEIAADHQETAEKCPEKPPAAAMQPTLVAAV